MRVIAGEAKGRKLRSVHSAQVRPSGDRVKEALFSSLGQRVVGSHVLDLYAGSGALGIEALSRGASHAVFVENDRKALEMIELNLDATGLRDRAEISAKDAMRFAREWPEPGGAFDLVLIDPPYVLGLPSDVIETLESRGLLSNEPVIVCEASSRKLPLEPPIGFAVEAEKRYGDSALVFLSKAPN